MLKNERANVKNDCLVFQGFKTTEKVGIKGDQKVGYTSRKDGYFNVNADKL